MSEESVIILDTCVLIHFANLDRFDILSKISNTKFITTENVILEITNETQLSKVKHCINSDLIKVVKLTDDEVMKDYFTLCKRLGKGEASCIALATVNNWKVCTDDKKRIPKTVQNRLSSNHLLTTDCLLSIGVSKGIITEKEKLAILDELNRISMERIARISLPEITISEL